MPEKRLVKSNSNRVICGVCGGIAEYFNIDPTIVRVGAVVLGAVYGSGLLIYFVSALVMPEA